ncbi:phage scaffolding protein [Anaerostipes sp. Marseille-Q3525]|jgi:hypothetical protein|uniref:phage scaffolding protein n=1 Tax=Anaerostipes sp. Marseille-Q3525 TaxID=2758418 RepID=UPI001BA8C56F|nr:hypothetical protein [Anaerostipes sp. Marseille-Q3525]MBR9960789.1 hypothetical protein [Anaerostipes sp. Marseille-Q3525]
MQNYEQILAELGIEIPEEKKAELKKRHAENYKTVADYNKQVEKKDEYKTSLDDVQTRLAELEKEDVDGLKTKITTLTQELADEKEARVQEAKHTELRDKVKDFLSDKKFVNAPTEEFIRTQMLSKLEKENGKNAEDVFKELTTKDGKPIENILIDEKKAKEPKIDIPSFTSKFNSGEQKKGYQKLTAMSLDEQMKLAEEDPDLYVTLLNDK